MARVRSRDSALGRLLATTSSAVYALDDQRRIVYCNVALGELLGVAPDALIGQRCEYRTMSVEGAPQDQAASLSPPPEVLTGSMVEADMMLLHADGHLLEHHVAFHPLRSPDSPGASVIALVSKRASSESEQPEAAELHRRLWTLRREMIGQFDVDELVGASPAIQRVRAQIDLVARSPTRVVVHGPRGSGREHVARLLHRRANPHAYAQLVPIFCPLLDAELLQTTITSLVRQSDMPSSGLPSDDSGSPRRAPTLLLLEIDQLSEEAQTELGGFLSLPGFEIYTIATSERSVIDLAEHEDFRTDLAYALSTVTIELPALAERSEDIPLLCQYFLEGYNARGQRQLSGFSPEAVDELAGYSWPENVDELSEVVELACERVTGTVVEVHHLPEQIGFAASADAHPRQEDEPIDLDEFLANIERELIQRALHRSKGNKTRAAWLLGINRARLHRRLEHFGIS
jgi:DNA-binding NtrC family response regulator